MIRLMFWCALRISAETWRLRSLRAMRQARESYHRALLFKGRADARDDRAEALYPRPSTGPPQPAVAAEASASAHQDGP